MLLLEAFEADISNELRRGFRTLTVADVFALVVCKANTANRMPECPSALPRAR